MMSVAFSTATTSSPALSEEGAEALDGFSAEREERTEEAPPCAEEAFLLFFGVSVRTMSSPTMSAVVGTVSVVTMPMMTAVMSVMSMSMMRTVPFRMVVCRVFIVASPALSPTSAFCSKREILVFFIRNNLSALYGIFNTCRHNVSRQRRLRHDYRSPWLSSRLFLR